MNHDWRRQVLVIQPIPGVIEPPKSDVFFCRYCRQLCLGEVGGSPMPEFMPGLKECGEFLVDAIMEL